MTLERWKLLAGGFGIALVGVVAMANPQCPGKPDPSREKAPPTREVALRPAVAPVAIPSASVKPEPIPTIPDVVILTPTFQPTPNVPALPVARQPETVVEIPLPAVLTTNSPPSTIAPLTIELPKVEPSTSIVLPVPTPTAAPPVLAPLPSPVVVSAAPPKAQSTTSSTPVPVPLPLTPAPTPFLEPQTAAPVVKDEVETRVRVVVPLGKSQAKFEVLAGETVLLQAVCEAVEVRSPNDKAEKGSQSTPIKASGKVRFTAPGCEGVCDSLAVLPFTGEVELTGRVRVTCKHGKAETEIQATTMRFKLGAAPAVIPVAATVR